MAEPQPLESAASIDSALKDRQIEALLVEGLDRYFNGQYEEAIHVWTRVLFLDRAHAPARAYIDRARTALAERQRSGEQMLEDSRLALDAGRTAAARDLLREAVLQGGDDDRASALRDRLERAERAQATAPMPGAGEDRRDRAVPGWHWSPRRRPAVVVAAVAAVALLGAVLVVEVAPGLPSLPGEAPPRVVGPQALPVLSSSDAALVRARTLYAAGRLAEALQALDRIGPESPNRPAADRLRIDVQRLLLATAQDRAGEGSRR